MTKSPHNSTYFDNSRLTSFMACPRHYFFRHVKHWETDNTPIYFTFGTAWHAAMDIIWSNADKHSAEELLTLADATFNQEWDKEVPKDYIPDIKQFRNPALGKDMLINYIKMRQVQIAAYDVLEIEKPFMVPIIEGTDIFYIGRIDKVFRDKTVIRFGEHKTSTSYSTNNGFQSSFLESFAPNNQIDGYIYQGKIMYGKEFAGINIDAALVHKNHHDIFKTIPISRLEQITEGWLWETQYWIMEIIDNIDFFDKLVESGDEPLHMPAFPKKTSSCMAFQGYTRCAYHDICRFQSENPTFMECPDNFVVKPWEPFKIIMGEIEEEED